MPRNPRHDHRAAERGTAATVLSRPQIALLAVLMLGLGFQAYRWGWHDSLITIVAACEIFYFMFVGFKIVLAVASYVPSQGGNGSLPSVHDPDLPTFTILLPNVKEKRHVLRALLVQGEDALDLAALRLEEIVANSRLTVLIDTDGITTEKFETPRWRANPAPAAASIPAQVAWIGTSAGSMKSAAEPGRTALGFSGIGQWTM